MKNNIKINAKNRTIEITKTFNKKASVFGSEEYMELKEAKLDNPTFKVVIKTTKQKRETNKGLTYQYMEKYIAAHDKEDKSIMEEYKMLRGLTDEAEECNAESCSYSEMKDWFFITFPEVENFHNKRNACMETIQKAKEEKIQNAKKAEKQKNVKASNENAEETKEASADLLNLPDETAVDEENRLYN